MQINFIFNSTTAPTRSDGGGIDIGKKVFHKNALIYGRNRIGNLGFELCKGQEAK